MGRKNHRAVFILLSLALIFLTMAACCFTELSLDEYSATTGYIAPLDVSLAGLAFSEVACPPSTKGGTLVYGSYSWEGGAAKEVLPYLHASEILTGNGPFQSDVAWLIIPERGANVYWYEGDAVKQQLHFRWIQYGSLLDVIRETYYDYWVTGTEHDKEGGTLSVGISIPIAAFPEDSVTELKDRVEDMLKDASSRLTQWSSNLKKNDVWWQLEAETVPSLPKEVGVRNLAVLVNSEQAVLVKAKLVVVDFIVDMYCKEGYAGWAGVAPILKLQPKYFKHLVELREGDTFIARTPDGLWQARIGEDGRIYVLDPSTGSWVPWYPVSEDAETIENYVVILPIAAWVVRAGVPAYDGPSQDLFLKALSTGIVTGVDSPEDVVYVGTRLAIWGQRVVQPTYASMDSEGRISVSDSIWSVIERDWEEITNIRADSDYYLALPPVSLRPHIEKGLWTTDIVRPAFAYRVRVLLLVVGNIPIAFDKDLARHLYEYWAQKPTAHEVWEPPEEFEMLLTFLGIAFIFMAVIILLLAVGVARGSIRVVVAPPLGPAG